MNDQPTANRASVRPAAVHSDPSATPGLIVVGCGNPFGGDDSAGLEITKRLREGAAGGAECLDLTGDAFDLLELFERADVILLVDAVQSGSPVGTVHLIPLPSGHLAARGLSKLSSHGWNLDATLRLARSLGRHVPRLMLLGIELASVEPGTPRTAAVNAALESVVAHFAELKAALVEADSPFWRGHRSYEPNCLPFGP